MTVDDLIRDRHSDLAPCRPDAPRETVKRSELAGWAAYGCCLPFPLLLWPGVGRHERGTLLAAEAARAGARPGPTRVADGRYYLRGFESQPRTDGLRLLGPARRGESERTGAALFRPPRQAIESINRTVTGQLGLERKAGARLRVCARVMQRILARAAAIWHGDRLGEPVLRSLAASDY